MLLFSRCVAVAVFDSYPIHLPAFRVLMVGLVKLLMHVMCLLSLSVFLLCHIWYDPKTGTRMTKHITNTSQTLHIVMGGGGSTVFHVM